jgi:hypothetical protein
MSDNDDSTPATPQAEPAPVLKTRWRDRAWTFRSMLTVGLASLVAGAVVGGVVGAAVSDDDDHERVGRFGPGTHMPPGWHHHGPGFNGDDRPGWRWDDGQPPGQSPTPYGAPTAPTPSSPTASSSGSAG